MALAAATLGAMLAALGVNPAGHAAHATGHVGRATGGDDRSNSSLAVGPLYDGGDPLSRLVAWIGPARRPVGPQSDG